MPKETFFNLSDEKREMIENVAIDEFAKAGFDMGSINTIVEKCGIAKGSFYQYFKNKKDLFIYLLMDVGAKKKLEYVTTAMQNPEEHNFFVLIKDMYLAGILYAKDHPKLSAIGMWTMKNSSHGILNDILKQSEDMAEKFYENLLQRAKEKGEIREDIDISIVAHMLFNLSVSTMEYCFKNDRAKDFSDISSMSDNILKTVDKLIDLLQFGINKNLGGSKL